MFGGATLLSARYRRYLTVSTLTQRQCRIGLRLSVECHSVEPVAGAAAQPARPLPLVCQRPSAVHPPSSFIRSADHAHHPILLYSPATAPPLLSLTKTHSFPKTNRTLPKPQPLYTAPKHRHFVTAIRPHLRTGSNPKKSTSFPNPLPDFLSTAKNPIATDYSF